MAISCRAASTTCMDHLPGGFRLLTLTTPDSIAARCRPWLTAEHLAHFLSHLPAIASLPLLPAAGPTLSPILASRLLTTVPSSGPGRSPEGLRDVSPLRTAAFPRHRRGR